jgi:hypothetical protein
MAELHDARIAGHSVSVRVDRESYSVVIDGDTDTRSLGEPLRVNW